MVAAFVGALTSAAAIYLLAWKRGLSSYRLVLVGIGVAAAVDAGTAYLLTKARIYDVQSAVVWLTGSLNGRTWADIRPLALAMLVLVPATLALGPSLRLLMLGDETAAGLGLRVERSRLLLVLVAVTLTALATAAAGPVEFVALLAAPDRAPPGRFTAGAGAVGPGRRGAGPGRRRRRPPGAAEHGPARRRRHRDHRGALPALAARPFQPHRHRRLTMTAQTHHTLAAEGLTLAYDKVEVARDLSLDIPAGRITCVVGANACGKSTLLRALARLLKPRAGSVLLDGQRIHSMSTKRSRRGSGSSRRPRSRPRASRWPTWSPAAATRTRPGCASGRSGTRRSSSRRCG